MFKRQGDTLTAGGASVSEPGTVYQQSVKEIDYSKYVGVLEIPKIGLKRGFYNTDSKYNSICLLYTSFLHFNLLSQLLHT